VPASTILLLESDATIAESIVRILTDAGYTVTPTTDADEAFKRVAEHQLVVLGATTGTHGDDLALLRLLLRGVGNDDPATHGLLLFDPANQDAVRERSNVH